MLVLFVFSGTFRISNISPELFLAPRGLITILLFYAIPTSIIKDYPEFDGILLFVILFSCLIMTWSLMNDKKKKERLKEEDFEIINSDNLESEEENIQEN